MKCRFAPKLKPYHLAYNFLLKDEFFVMILSTLKVCITNISDCMQSKPQSGKIYHAIQIKVLWILSFCFKSLSVINVV